MNKNNLESNENKENQKLEYEYISSTDTYKIKVEDKNKCLEFAIRVAQLFSGYDENQYNIISRKDNIDDLSDNVKIRVGNGIYSIYFNKSQNQEFLNIQNVNGLGVQKYRDELKDVIENAISFI